MAGAHRRPRGRWSGGPTDADVRAEDVALDDEARAVVHAACAAAESRAGPAVAARRAPGRATRWRSPRWRSSWACRCRTSRRRSAARAAGAAAGGWRSPTAPDGVTRRQRRLQRQPGVGARRAGGAGRAWATGRRTWAVLGEMRELGDDRDRRARRDRPARRAARRVAGSSWSGREPARSTPGRRQEGSWGEESVARAGRRGGARAAARAQLRPGDVVLVKARSRDAGLRQLLGRPAAREAARMRTVLVAAAVVADRLAVRHAAVHPLPGQARLRPVHPGRRPDLAPHQARHPDDGRRRHHRGRAARLRRGAPGHREPADDERGPGAVPDDRAGRGRLRWTTTSRSSSSAASGCGRAQAGRPGRRRDRCSRCWRCSSRTTRSARRPRRRSRSSGTPAFDLAFAGAALGVILFVHLGVPDDRRDEQRREPHRRPRRPGHRRLRDGVRGVRADRHLAVQPELPALRREPVAAEVLRGPRPARPRGGRGRRDGRLLRLPVVERLAGEDLHGRHRLARPRRRARRPGDHHPHRAAAAARSAACSCSSRCR